MERAESLEVGVLLVEDAGESVDGAARIAHAPKETLRRCVVLFLACLWVVLLVCPFLVFLFHLTMILSSCISTP